MIAVLYRAYGRLRVAMRELDDLYTSEDAFRRGMADVVVPQGEDDSLRARLERWLTDKAKGLPVRCTYWSASIEVPSTGRTQGDSAWLILPPPVVAVLFNEMRDRATRPSAITEGNLNNRNRKG